MAKFEELFEDVQGMFDTVIELADLQRYDITVKVIADNRLKKIYDVVKANAVTKHLVRSLTNETEDVDVIIIINQKIFEKLPEDIQEIIAIESMAGVAYDTEKDKLIISKPNVNAFHSVIKKYGWDSYERMLESVKSLYDAKQNEENLNKTK